MIIIIIDTFRAKDCDPQKIEYRVRGPCVVPPLVRRFGPVNARTTARVTATTTTCLARWVTRWRRAKCRRPETIKRRMDGVRSYCYFGCELRVLSGIVDFKGTVLWSEKKITKPLIWDHVVVRLSGYAFFLENR